MAKEIAKQSGNKNLHRGNPAWKKGVSGNPGGRPRKELSITQALRDYMHEVPSIKVGGQENTDKTWAQLVALGMLLEAVKGGASMAHEIIDRLEGKVVQPITGEGGKPVAINIHVLTEGGKKLTEEIIKGARTG